MFGGRRKKAEKQPDTETLAHVEVGKVVVEVRGSRAGGSTGSLVINDGGKVTDVALNLDDASKIKVGLTQLQGELRILVTNNISGRREPET